MHEEIELTRDCNAIRIPQGNTITLPKGSRVVVTQSLGGSYTVATDTGFLVRITDVDADALGFERPAAPEIPVGEGGVLDDKAVWDQLKTCYDPEIPVNIVDLGLVYDCSITRPAEGSSEGAKILVQMTLTAPGCGMGPTLAAEAKSKLEGIPGVDEANVELVWDPPWNQSMISEAGKMKLGLI